MNCPTATTFLGSKLSLKSALVLNYIQVEQSRKPTKLAAFHDVM